LNVLEPVGTRCSLKIGCHQYSKATHQVDHWKFEYYFARWKLFRLINLP
jgi:hypothetical protein